MAGLPLGGPGLKGYQDLELYPNTSPGSSTGPLRYSCALHVCLACMSICVLKACTVMEENLNIRGRIPTSHCNSTCAALCGGP